VNYAELLAALVNARPDTEVRVRTRGSASYRVVAAEVELDLGEHIDPASIDQDANDAPPGEQRRRVASARRRQAHEVSTCDGRCTEHRAMLSDERTVWLTVEKA
jgi:hypothetical protein